MLDRLVSRPCAWKGLISGLAGGLVATIVMTQFQNTWTRVSKAFEQKQDKKKAGDQQGEDATMKAAGKLANATGHQLSREMKEKAGPVIHYGFGTAIGGLYGLSYEFAPRNLKSLHPVLAGGGYGTAVFVGADEVAVPALGLSQSANKAAISSHIYGRASHLVYGMTLEMTRRIIRRNV